MKPEKEINLNKKEKMLLFGDTAFSQTIKIP
nr:MAG TPA: hypothetical protein [Caudoviricetes sp.]